MAGGTIGCLKECLGHKGISMAGDGRRAGKPGSQVLVTMCLGRTLPSGHTGVDPLCCKNSIVVRASIRKIPQTSTERAPSIETAPQPKSLPSLRHAFGRSFSGEVLALASCYLYLPNSISLEANRDSFTTLLLSLKPLSQCLLVHLYSQASRIRLDPGSHSQSNSPS